MCLNVYFRMHSQYAFATINPLQLFSMSADRYKSTKIYIHYFTECNNLD